MSLTIDAKYRDIYEAIEEPPETAEIVHAVENLAFQEFDRAWILMILDSQDKTLAHLARTLQAVRQRYREKTDRPGYCEKCGKRCLKSRYCHRCRNTGDYCLDCGQKMRRKGTKRCATCFYDHQRKASSVARDKQRPEKVYRGICERCGTECRIHRRRMCHRCYRDDLKKLVTHTADRKRKGDTG